MFWEGRRGRIIMTLATITAATVLGTAGPAPAQVVPEVEALDYFAPIILGYVDCDGTLDTEDIVEGGVLLILSQPPATDISIPVSYSGTLADDLVDPPTTAEVPAGEEFAEVYFQVDDVEPGTLTITAEPGVGYTTGPGSSVSFEVAEEPELVADCTTELDSPVAGRDDQTIQVGGEPEPLGFFENRDGTITVGVIQYPDGTEESFQDGDIGGPIEGGSTPVVAGRVPPGLRYGYDDWDGAATTPGTSDFTVAACLDDAFYLGGTRTAPTMRRAVRAIPSTLCFGSLDVRVSVVAAAVVDPGTTPSPTAPAATPVATDARFTG